MTDSRIYEDIAQRTGGDIYLGVVGPVRTGKSTFIKRFMETLVIPNIQDVYRRERARDELPQSGSGKTIMTAEPKFVPEEAASITLGDGAAMEVRLIDCVGFMVPGAVGQYEDGAERMVTTPWFDHEIPISQAAEQGTSKVIREHSTIGLVITTDGSFGELPREAYREGERRAVEELREIGKPFAVVVNSALPGGESCAAACRELQEELAVEAIPLNCAQLTEEDISALLRKILLEFPMSALGVFWPAWVDALPVDHPIRAALLEALRSRCQEDSRLRDIYPLLEALGEEEYVEQAQLLELDLGTGAGSIRLRLPDGLYYETISDQSGFTIRNDGDLMALLSEMHSAKEKYDRIASALDEVEEKGYGIVLPSPGEMVLQEPEIIRQGGKYTVRLKASAPCMHVIRTDIETAVTPALGGEKASQEIMNFLLQGFDGDVNRIWESNIFGKSLYDIAGEGLIGKIRSMSPDAQNKLRSALQRIINEGSGGLICIIL